MYRAEFVDGPLEGEEHHRHLMTPGPPPRRMGFIQRPPPRGGWLLIGTDSMLDEGEPWPRQVTYALVEEYRLPDDDPRWAMGELTAVLAYKQVHE